MSKKIKIRRKAVISTLPDPILLDANTKIGGSLTKNGSILKGITHDEEAKFLPRVLGVPYEHQEFMQRSDSYYNKMNIPVPEEGNELEIGTVVDTKDEKVPFIPLNMDHWLKYKYAIAHREVAPNKANMHSDPNYRYYIEDMDADVESTNKGIKEKQAAFKEFIKISEDEARAELVLRVLAPQHDDRISTFKTWTKEQKENKLSLYLDKNPKLFYEVCADKDIALKAEIESMVDALVIQKVGNAYIFGSEPLGDDMAQVIAKLKAPSNSELYTILKAKLEALGGSLPKAAKSK